MILEGNMNNAEKGSEEKIRREKRERKKRKRQIEPMAIDRHRVVAVING